MAGDKPTGPLPGTPPDPIDTTGRGDETLRELSKPGEGRKEDPQGTGKPRRPDPIDRTRRELETAALDLEDQVNSLPPYQKLTALLGFTKTVEAKYLPPIFKALQITIPRDRLADVNRIMNQENALPIGDNFLGNPDDQKVTLTYVIPHVEPESPNNENIIKALNTESIMAEIAIASNVPIIVRASGRGLTILGADFSDKKQTGTPDPKRKTGIDPSLTPETTYSSRQSLLSAREDKAGLPRQGECMYLLLEDNFVDAIRDRHNPYLKHILNQLAIIFTSSNFHVSRQNGYLVVVNTAERAGSYLVSLAESISKASGRHTSVFVGKGSISHSREGAAFDMKGMPTHEEMGGELIELSAGIYLHPDIYDASTERLKGRDGAQFHTVARKHPMHRDSKWLELQEHKPSVELTIGGPDKLVGYEEELQRLNDALNDTETKLTVLKAAAGMGKSRLLSEVAKENPSMIILTLDPSGKNIQGGGLVTMAEQIAQYVELHAEESDHGVIGEIQKFASKSQDEKTLFAQRNPKQLVATCMEALDFLRQKLGQLKIVVDDVHHVDRHSDAYLMTMLAHLLSEDSGNKVVLSMRPEERYSSNAQRTFESQVRSTGKGAVKTIALNGLDFSDEKISREFVYHSLPAEFRKGNTLGGDWWRRLGRKAGRFPLAMMTYMDAILAKHDTLTRAAKPSILTAPEREIHLQGAFLAELESMPSHGDLDRYYREKIDKLPENLRSFMQGVALLGGTITEAQIGSIEQITGQVSYQELEEVLVTGRYLVRSMDGKYRVQHQTIVDSINASMNDSQRVAFSMRLYDAFKTDQSISEETKLALLHNVAPQAQHDNAPFWKEYSARTRVSLTMATKNNAYGQGYGTARTVLGASLAELETLPERKKTAVHKGLDILTGRSTDGISTDMASLLVNTLGSLGRNAMMLGRFDEAEKALNILDTILTRARRTDILRKELYLTMFQLAYVTKDKAKLNRIYADKLKGGEGLPIPVRAVLELQLVYITTYMGGTPAKADEFSRIYLEKSDTVRGLADPQNPSFGEYLETVRLGLCRVPFEGIRHAAVNREEGKKFDEDVLLQRQALNADQLRKLMEIDEGIDFLLKQRREHPLAFNAHSEMGLLDLRAQVKALLGNHKEAIAEFSEYWRQANQMEIHKEAARAAKMKGDVQMVQAFSRHQIDRERVIEAIRTYSEEGVKSLTGISGREFYQFSIRIQRIRAVGALASSYLYEMETRKPKPQEIEQMKQELLPHIETAFKDFEYLNQNEPWKTCAEDGEVQYYLMSYMGYVLTATEKFQIPVPNLKEEGKYPYMTAIGIQRGKEHANVIVDEPENDLGEKARKLTGLELAGRFVQ